MATILEQIAAYKRDWVAACKKRTPVAHLLEQATCYTPLDFSGALAAHIDKHETAIIAEVKKASPSKGVIRADFDPVAIAKAYEVNGACCLSVLTDVKFFQGSDDFVRMIRASVSIPVLRKDFMLDSYQVVEARSLGADCILIIMAMVDDNLADELCRTASEMGLDVLPEVHNRAELDRALRLSTRLIGINNRDLHTFETRLDTTLSLLEGVPDGKLVISESGIFSPDDISMLQREGVYGFLVGESLMRQPDPGQALAQLLR